MPAPRRAAPIALVLLIAVSAGVRFWAARGMDLPWIAPDETIYALLGRSLWEDGSSTLLGAPADNYSFVYPALIGLPLTIGDLDTGVAVVQALGALLMSSTALLVYLWGRGPLGAWWAVAAAGLTLAVPDLAYSGLLMSEVAVFPVATLAVWAIAAALTRPSPRRQALVAATIVLASGDARSAGGADPDAVRGCRSPVRLRAVARAGATPGRPPGRHRGCVRPHARGLRRRRALGPRLRRVRRGRGRIRARRRGGRRDLALRRHLHPGRRHPADRARGDDDPVCPTARVRPGGVCARRDDGCLDVVPRARGRNVRLALGRARHPAGPPAGHPAADARVCPLDRAGRATTSPVDPDSPHWRSPFPPCSCRWTGSPIQESALDAVSMIPLWRLAEATLDAGPGACLRTHGRRARRSRCLPPEPAPRLRSRRRRSHACHAHHLLDAADRATDAPRPRLGLRHRRPSLGG